LGEIIVSLPENPDLLEAFVNLQYALIEKEQSEGRPIPEQLIRNIAEVILGEYDGR
jgi:hypothetical protein